MKQNRSIFFAFGFLIISASLYRIWDGRPLGFAPQIAMAIFAGAVIKKKQWAFILPILSLFISDTLYHVLYINGLTEISGFYSGQFTNYLLFGGLVAIGFLIKNIKVSSVLLASLAAPTAYFMVSNLLVWLNGGGFARPKTLDGLILCYADAMPFYRGSLVGTLVFSTILFGGFYLIQQFVLKNKSQLA